MIKIAPSILSADFARLGQQLADTETAGADYIHVDVMDGHFVPNITIGPLIVQAAHRSTRLPLDVHLMIEHPEAYIPAFAKAGANIITVHVEACAHLHRTLYQIKDCGCRAGVTLNPHTPLSAIEEVLNDADLVLVMTVNPGFGGQEFIERGLDKIRRLRQMLDVRQATAELEVDGGIRPGIAERVIEAGGRVLVAGSAVYGHPAGISAAIADLRRCAV